MRKRNLMALLLLVGSTSVSFAVTEYHALRKPTSSAVIAEELTMPKPVAPKMNATEVKDSVFVAPNYKNGFTVVLFNNLSAQGTLAVKNSKGEVVLNAAFTGHYESNDNLPTGNYTIEVNALQRKVTRNIRIE